MFPMNNPLEDYRQAHGLTYRAMAQRVGGQSYVTTFYHCRGLRQLSAESALRYHHAFGIPLSDLRPDLWPPEGAQKSYRQDGEGS